MTPENFNLLTIVTGFEHMKALDHYPSQKLRLLPLLTPKRCIFFLPLNYRPGNPSSDLLKLKDSAKCYCPVQLKTTPKVLKRIFKSSQRDQLSIYSRSNFAHWSKSRISLRPFTCQRQVSPGLRLSFLRCQLLKRSTSPTKGGRGPTKLISPFKTL